MKKTVVISILSLLIIDLVFLVFLSLWAAKASAETGDEIFPTLSYGMMRDRAHHEMMPGFPGMRGEGLGPDALMPDEHRLWGRLMELSLDEKQTKKMQRISNNLMKGMIRNRTDEQLVRIDLMGLLAKDPVDIKAVETKLRRIEAIKTESELSFIRAIEEVKSQLSPAQKKLFRERPNRGPMTEDRGLLGWMSDDPLEWNSYWEEEEDLFPGTDLL
jgi:hypothetical protein